MKAQYAGKSEHQGCSSHSGLLGAGGKGGVANGARWRGEKEMKRERERNKRVAGGSGQGGAYLGANEKGNEVECEARWEVETKKGKIK